MTQLPDHCFCCGSELSTARIEGRERAYCTECDQPVYRNAKPCAGTLVVDGSAVLLVKRTNPPAVGSWSLPAGYLEIDERPEDAAARELAEETGLSVSPANLELFETNLVAHPDGRYVLVIIYRTERTATEGSVTAGSDAADARFWTLSELSASDESIEPSYEPIIRKVLDTDQEPASSS